MPSFTVFKHTATCLHQACSYAFVPYLTFLALACGTTEAPHSSICRVPIAWRRSPADSRASCFASMGLHCITRRSRAFGTACPCHNNSHSHDAAPCSLSCAADTCGVTRAPCHGHPPELPALGCGNAREALCRCGRGDRVEVQLPRIACIQSGNQVLQSSTMHEREALPSVKSGLRGGGDCVDAGSCTCRSQQCL